MNEDIEAVGGMSNEEDHESLRGTKRFGFESLTLTRIASTVSSRRQSSTVKIALHKKVLDRKVQSLPPELIGRLRSVPDLLRRVADLAQDRATIHEIAREILRLELVLMEKHEHSHDMELATTLVFTILGWQTMLYEPSISSTTTGELMLADILDGFQSQSMMVLKQDQSNTTRPTANFLLAYGLMLPKANLCTSEDPDDCASFNATTIVNPNGINAAILKRLAGVKVVWVDSLAPHLEFDKATNTIFLFRYPSFCLANIAVAEKSPPSSLLHALAAVNDDPPLWAGNEEITSLLQEIVLSYRLLFGQTRASRRLFRSLRVFAKDEIHDPLLSQLCSDTASPLPSQCKERDFYRLARDFPVLRQRIAILQRQLQDVKPHGWRALWSDKRDTVQWYTFWAVVVFGGIGVILTLLQVVLQGMQLSGVG